MDTDVRQAIIDFLHESGYEVMGSGSELTVADSSAPKYHLATVTVKEGELHISATPVASLGLGVMCGRGFICSVMKYNIPGVPLEERLLLNDPDCFTKMLAAFERFKPGASLGFLAFAEFAKQVSNGSFK